MKHSILNLIINVNNSFDFFPRTKFNIVAEFKLFLAFQIYKKNTEEPFSCNPAEQHNKMQ